MITGKTYKVTVDGGDVFTGEFHPGSHDSRFIIGTSVLWYGEVENIERLEYTKKTIDKHVSKIGIPRG